ncbi:MAG: hypothetical protein AAGL96_15405, partial [Pseudomonadota bacterium]
LEAARTSLMALARRDPGASLKAADPIVTTEPCRPSPSAWLAESRRKKDLSLSKAIEAVSVIVWRRLEM